MPTTFIFDTELAARIDAARGPHTREEFVFELIERELALFERPIRASPEDEAFAELEERLR